MEVNVLEIIYSKTKKIMNKIMFETNDIKIDYNLIGSFPKNIDKIKTDEELIDLFVDCFNITFSSTVFSYYGDIEECKNLISSSLIMDDLDFSNRTNKQKWNILLLIAIEMFFKMHNTYLAQDTVEEVCENFDNFDDEEMNKIIYDLNFALFFGIEECLALCPSQIRNLNGSDEDTILLPELLDSQKEIINIIKTTIKRKDINKEHFEKMFKIPISENYALNLFNGLISTWIELMEPEIDLSEENWETVSVEVFAIIQTFLSLVLNNTSSFKKILDSIYYFIINLLKNTYNLDYDIFHTPN